MSSIVSSITGQRGGNSGGAGLNYNADSATILNPASVDQANQQYTNANAGLDKQNAFLQAVQAQNGLGNQSQVYNQLQGVANGTGPNPAQAQLAQATGANVANQNALMAGQRGASQNVGLIGRQAAMQGANTQQQAAGQAATMQANQSLNALGQMGQLATNQANQQANATNAYSNSAQGEQGQVLGAIQGQNNANVGMTSNQNSSNAGVSQVAAGQQGQLIGNVVGGAGAALQALASGGRVMMADGGGMPSGVTQLMPTPIPANGSQPQQGPMSAAGQYFSNASGGGPGSAGNSIGTAIGKGLHSLFASKPPPAAGPTVADQNSQMWNAGRPDMMEGVSAPAAMESAPELSSLGEVAMMAAKGGQVPVLLSPGEKKLTAKEASEVAAGKKDPKSAGTTVPGKPKVGGNKNSYANDTVKSEEKPGTVILPRSVTQSNPKDFERNAIAFVRAVMAKNGSGLK